MSDQSAAPERARRTPRWLLAILVASLLLNGLIVGGVAARRWAFGPHMPWPGSSVNAHLVGFAVTLPGERRRVIWQSTEALRAEMRPVRKVMQQARDDVRAVLVADPFDPQRFEAAQKRLFDAEQETRRATLKLIQSIAVQLTPQERASFAEWEHKDRSRRQAFWRQMREDNKEAGQSSDGPKLPEAAKK
ncbi:MAG: periplasmic heavy metal sensor [Hyphomicrobiaceae bacterium]